MLGKWWEKCGTKKKRTYSTHWRVVCRQVVLQYRKVRHGRVHEGRELLVTILRDDEVPPPGEEFAIVRTLDLLEALVDWEGHPIPRQHRVKYDVGIYELLVHPV
jgi:hypothetical protein